MDSCEHKINEFCYMCGKFTIPSLRTNITARCEWVYEFCFGMTIRKNVSWAPNSICKVCRNASYGWFLEKRDIPFKSPVIWNDPGQHDPANCYVCCNDVNGVNRNKKNSFAYTSVPSAILPVPFEEGDIKPKKPSPTIDSLIMPSTSRGTQVDVDDVSYQPSQQSENVKKLPQNALNKVVRKLNLSQKQAELLARELKSAKVLDPRVKVTGYRFREEPFIKYFVPSENNTYAFCHNIFGLMSARNVEYVADEWRLFIDSSKSGLKGVLLFHDNSLKPVPVFYAVGMKETYASMRFIFEKIHYDDHKWRISGDLKVIALVTGMQSGYTKYCCFLCLWDSRYKENQYSRKIWPDRTSRRAGSQNIAEISLVSIEKILLPPLHIKLGIVKNFVKALDREGPAFQYLKTKFPRLSEAKLKEGKYHCITSKKKSFFPSIALNLKKKLQSMFQVYLMGRIFEN